MLRLQLFGHKDSHYERPAQKWVCGRADEGSPCALGPGNDGLCQAAVECFPFRDGDRWKCTRDQLRGGRCNEGPLPDGSCAKMGSRCLPRLILRERRGLLTRWLVLFSLSILVIALNSSSKMDFVSPGNLSFHHGTSTETCGDCHTNASASSFSWIATAFSPHSKENESRLCTECHDFDISSMKAHSLDSETLAGIRDELGKQADNSYLSLMSRLLLADGKSWDSEQSLACATCHKEHKGKSASLVVLSDQQCQFCHLIQFDSFSEGHPEISGYTFQRRPRIIFDHQSHKGKHYPEDNTDFACVDCHQPDIQGETMLSPAFDKDCGDCHRAQIEGEGRADEMGIAVLTIPGLDVETLIQRKLSIGEWPEYAESKINPFMAFLLATDSQLAGVFSALEDIDLLDLSEASDAQLVAVQKVAWATKRLLFDFHNEGHRAIETRVRQLLVPHLTSNQMTAVTGGLAADVVGAAQRNWFPNLENEMELYAANKMPPASYVTDPDSAVPAAEPDQTNQNPVTDDEIDDFDFSDIDVDELEDESVPEEAKSQNTLTEADWVRTGGWYRRDFTLFYRPAGHSDQFIRFWINLTALQAERITEPAAKIFSMLTNPKAPGLCMKCHSIDNNADAQISINWRGKRPKFEQRSFTRFSHKPHFSLIESKGCITCHTWNKDPKMDFEASYENLNPSSYSSNFSSLTKTVCAECHSKNLAGERCLSCHNYHVGSFPELSRSIKTQ